MKYLLYSLLLLSSVFCVAQSNPPQKVSANYQFKSAGADSGGIRFPVFQTLPVSPDPNYVDTAGSAVAFQKSDSNFYRWSNKAHQWVCTSCGGSSPKLDSVYRMLINTFAGDTDIVIYAGTVRPFSSNGTDIYWKWISDTTVDHFTLNFTTPKIGTLPDGFTVYYPHITKAVTFLAVPDESSVLGAWQFGASFGLDSANVRITRLHQGFQNIFFDSSVHSANCIDLEQPGADGIGTTYDSLTGVFTSTPSYFKSSTGTNIGIPCTASPNWFALYDGNASFGQAFIKWKLIDRVTGLVHTGCRVGFSPAAAIMGPAFYAPEVCNVTSGSLIPVNSSWNIWILAIGKKH